MPWLHNMSLILSSHVSALVRTVELFKLFIGLFLSFFLTVCGFYQNNPAKRIVMKVEETIDEVTKKKFLIAGGEQIRKEGRNSDREAKGVKCSAWGALYLPVRVCPSQ